MEIDSVPAALNKTSDNVLKDSHMKFGKPSFDGKFLSVTSGNEPRKHKKKFKPLVPKLSEKSKVIGKGTAYSEKMERRKVAKNFAGPSMGGNRLNQKKVKDNFRVPGMALTAQQKK